MNTDARAKLPLSLLRGAALIVASWALLAFAVRLLAAVLRWPHLPSGWPPARLIAINPAVFAGAAALLALQVLPPLRRRWLERLLAALMPVFVLAVVAIGPRALHLSGVPAVDPLTQTIGYVPGTCHTERRGPGPATTACVNAVGHRGERTGLEPREGERRILLVGDSFVFGSGVNDSDTLAVQLDNTLAAQRRPRRSVTINAGLPGLNLASDLRMATQLLPRVHPDVLVIGYLAGNDAEPVDKWTWLDFWTPRGLVLLGMLRVDRDLFAAEQSMPAPLEPVLAQKLVPLLALAKEERTNVLLLSYADAAVPFARYQDEHFHVVVPPQMDPAERDVLEIPGDGHPTAAGNRRFAELLVGEILRR